MSLERILVHLVHGRRSVRRAFPTDSLAAIEQAIASAERSHGGEIHVALEGALHARALLHGQTPRQRAIELFAHLHVWDTSGNNGVLIYVLMADRAVEIVADRHVHAKVGNATWEAIAHRMKAAFTEGRFGPGMLDGIAAVGAELARHYPHPDPGGSQVPDAPTVL